MTSRKGRVGTDVDLPAAPEAPPAEAVNSRGRLGRLAFVFLSLLSVTLVHLPWLPLEVQSFGHAYTNLTGQEVRWTMFSPDPRGTSINLWAEVFFSDGTHSTWVMDRTGGGGDFGFYRIVKWMEGAVLNPAPGSLEAFASYLISSSGRPVDRVEIWTSQQRRVPPDQEQPPVEVEMVLSFEPGDLDG